MLYGIPYQFRVALFTQDGYNGYSEASKIITVFNNYTEPRKPLNFRLEREELLRNEVSVTLVWDTPVKLGKFDVALYNMVAYI